MVYVLRARIRNTQAVGAILSLSDTEEARKALRTADIGHHGSPVHTAFCRRTERDAGSALAEVVWSLDKELSIHRPSMAVVFSVSNERPRIMARPSAKRVALADSFTPFKVDELTAEFYQGLRKKYIDVPGGKKDSVRMSLIPLPLFALDFESHDQGDLQVRGVQCVSKTRALKDICWSQVQRFADRWPRTFWKPIHNS
jgi:hypothetical protein